MIIEPSVSQPLVESTQATWKVSVNNFWHMRGLLVTSNSPNAKLRTEQSQNTVLLASTQAAI